MRSVTGIQFEKGGFLSVMGHFVILVSGGDNRRVQVPNTPKSIQIIEQINAYITECQKKQEAPAVSVAFSVADELNKLASLKQQGFLTEEEFQQQKQKLLSA